MGVVARLGRDLFFAVERTEEGAERVEGRQEGRQEGLKEGKQVGIQQGALIGKIQQCQQMLNLSVSDLRELETASVPELEARLLTLEAQLKDRLT